MLLFGIHVTEERKGVRVQEGGFVVVFKPDIKMPRSFLLCVDNIWLISMENRNLKRNIFQSDIHSNLFGFIVRWQMWELQKSCVKIPLYVLWRVILYDVVSGLSILRILRTRLDSVDSNTWLEKCLAGSQIKRSCAKILSPRTGFHTHPFPVLPVLTKHAPSLETWIIRSGKGIKINQI